MRSHPHRHAHLHAFCCGIPAQICLRAAQVETEFSLLLEENPLTDLVELPEELRGLKSSPPCPVRAVRAVDQLVRAAGAGSWRLTLVFPRAGTVMCSAESSAARWRWSTCSAPPRAAPGVCSCSCSRETSFPAPQGAMRLP